MATFMGRVLTIEIRTLNSKQADLNVRVPSLYREKEFELRDALSAELYRGKIDLIITRDLAPGEGTTALNETLVQNYYHLLKKMEAGMSEPTGQTTTDYLNLILKMPDALKSAADELDPAEYAVLRQAFDTCMQHVMAFRAQEGGKLEIVLRDSVQRIQTLLKAVEPFEGERMERIRQRITTNLSDDSNEGSTLAFDKDRFEQELIYYLEKLDISEEKVRLSAHCEYFLQTMKDEQFKGKKLSFIAQEMGREINTLGSKAQHSEMQRLVVEMKDELEKIKEQVLNVL